MNILMVCHYGLYQDFSSSFVHQQAKAFAEAGHSVRVIIPVAIGKKDAVGQRFGPAIQRRYADGVELYYLRHWSLSRYGIDGFNTQQGIRSVKKQLATLLDGFLPDVIHAHTIGFDSEIGAWIKEQIKCPLVVASHGSDASIPYEQGKLEFIRCCCNKADTIVAVSSALADKIRKSGTETPVCCVLNGFALRHLLAEESKEQMSFLQVSNLLQQKRVHLTIQAFAQIQKAYPTAKLTVVGEGSERESLEQLCQDLGVAKSVRFTGQISNQEVLETMARTQFFVMPSVREGFGIVYLEAMASGCVTIGTAGEGIADLIRSGENGFLVPPDDLESITDVIEWCIAHPDETQSIVQKGKMDASLLTWEKNAETYLALFKKIIERI